MDCQEHPVRFLDVVYPDTEEHAKRMKERVSLMRHFFIGKRRHTMTEAYCVKCKTKREMKDPKSVTLKNGKPAMQGTCPVCGTKLFRIGAK